MGKTYVPPPPGVYRDDPDDAASMSSAVLLGDIDFPGEELPAYEDSPSVGPLVPEVVGTVARPATIAVQITRPPDLPWATNSRGCQEFRTRFPDYSNNANVLFNMIQEQTRYPPQYFVRLSGTHSEKNKQAGKDSKTTVTDFSIAMDITKLLVPADGAPDRIELLFDHERGYRGGRIKGLNPSVRIDDSESQLSQLRAWCEKYVSDPAPVKSFTLKRKIENHDTKKVEQLLRAAVADTNYRGHVRVEFVKTHKRLIVYSPCKTNELRITVWIRWFFYLTFLWLFAWPYLFFVTRRYEVITAFYQYADYPPGQQHRTPTVMSEVDWVCLWEKAIKRAVLSRLKCADSILDDDYRIAAERAEPISGLSGDGRQSTGSAIADGALGILEQGLRIAGNHRVAQGWGGDC